LFGGSTSGKVYRIPTTAQYTDDGFAYTSSATTGLADFSGAQKYQGFPMRKRLKRVDVLPTPGTVLGSVGVALVKSDDGFTQTTLPVGAVFGTAVFGSSTFAGANPGWFDQTAVYFGLQFTDSGNTLAWELKQSVLDVEPEGDR
jgi:hypothetical protein